MTTCLFGLTSSNCETCSRYTGLFRDIASCKAGAGGRAGDAPVCESLKLRTQFFEPNSGSLTHWQESHGFYKPDIDRRVLFVCESPKSQSPRAELSNHPCYSTRKYVVDDSEGNEITGYRAWDRMNPRAEPFLAARTPSARPFTNYQFESARYHGMFGDLGLHNCMITNVVLCAGLDGPKPSAYVRHCAGEFLTRTLGFLRPLEVVILGGDAASWYRGYRRDVNPEAPAAREIFHYSVRPKDIAGRFKSWDEAAQAMRRSLPAEPVWLHPTD